MYLFGTIIGISYNFVFLVNVWPGIILVQCRGNLCNIGATFEATGSYQKINRFKIKIAKKGCCSENNTVSFFLQNFLSSLLALHRDFSSAMLSQQEYWDNIEQFFLLCNVAWSLLDNIAQGFYLCNVVPRVLRQHWAGIFPVQCCLEPLGKHCARILPLQCCPSKSIDTALNSSSSCAMLSVASWTTLHKNFTCSMLSQGYYDNIEQEFFLCNVV